MLFLERKQKNGFTYDLEDIFGTLHIESEKQLDKDLLDGMVVLLLKQTYTAQRVEGDIKTPVGKVSYTFTKRPQWEDDDEKEPCKDTPTSTKRPEKGSTPKYRSTIPVLNWFKRFVVASREAWRKAKN